jgi:hypothetical protein
VIRFVKLNRQAIGIREKSVAAIGQFIHADWFHFYPFRLQVTNAAIDVCDLEGKMPESAGFGIGWTGGGTGKGKQLNLAAARKNEVEFIGLTGFAVCFPDNREAEHFGVELFGAGVVGTDDRDVV